MTDVRDKKICLLVGAGLVGVTLLLFWPITSYPFITFDDNEYIVDNPFVTSGLSRANFLWAFSIHAANWHPLTWLSHQLDCSLFGLDAGKHHLVNVLLHAGNTVLVFFFLRAATGALWRSALVAALFVWHPLHVESVAWASERKDTLSTFFWLLTLLAYTRYARSGHPLNLHSKAFYALALLFFFFGLMSKPMVVTLPCVLILIDVWPLGRLSNFKIELSTIKRLLVEKIPFFTLSALGCVVTYLAQKTAMNGLPFFERVDNALVAYAGYVIKFFWPTNLAIAYSHPKTTPWLLALGALALLLLCSATIVLNSQRRSYLLVGWLWFLGTLVPAIGLVQVGSQSMADRYTYIPSIGLFIAVVWGMAELLRNFPNWKFFPAVVGAVVLSGCVALTVKQISYWQSSIILFRHALEASPDNYIAANSLGKAYEVQGDTSDALLMFRTAVENEPRYWPSQFNLAQLLFKTGDVQGGWEHLQMAAKDNPGNPAIQCNVAVYHMSHQHWAAAAAAFRLTLREEPDNDFARVALDVILRAHPEVH